MALSGNLKTWHADRGFGFIAPHGGGPDVFVHISEYPRGGGQPVVGEQVFYDLGRGKNGKVQAVRVYRKGEQDVRGPQRRVGRRAGKRDWLSLGIAVLIGATLLMHFNQKRQDQKYLTTRLTADSAVEEPATPEAMDRSRCDGRTHCSQMTSCAEAKYFLRNCPGMEMDGDGDGVPCEGQWCRLP